MSCPGVVPVEVVLGRSDTTVVFLTGIRAYPTGLAMTLFEFADGRWVTNIDRSAWSDQPNRRVAPWPRARLARTWVRRQGLEPRTR